MAWNSPRTWVANVTAITAAALNTDLRDNLLYLFGFTDGSTGGTITRPSGNDDQALRWLLGGSRYARVQAAAGTAIFLAANGYYDGTNWNRDDTSQPIMRVGIDQTAGIFAIGRAAAGSNPATIIELLDVDSGGKLTGAGFYDSGPVSVANGVTQSFAHGFGVRPRFVFGLFGNPTVAVPVAIYVVAAATCRLTQVDITNITVNNAVGSTTFIQMFAIK